MGVRGGELDTFSSVDTDTREGVQVVQTDTVEFM
jgi:hypothetical protein